MKKLISAVSAVVIGISSFTLVSASAEKGNAEAADITLLGDSIATGYNRSGYVEHNYGELIEDYLGCNVNNLAVNGAKTGDLITQLDESGTVESIKNSDYVVISIGGNNLITDLSEFVGSFAIENDLLKDEYADETSINLLLKEDLDKLDKEKFKALGFSGQQALATQMESTLTGENSDGGTLYNDIIPDTRTILEKVHEINPDAEIVLQTVYQPFSFSKEYYASYFGNSDAPYYSYRLFISFLRGISIRTMDKYSAALTSLCTELNADGEYVRLADVYDVFASFPENYDSSEWGSCWYFTDILEAGEKRDFHPNQKGHLIIAALVLEQIGELHDTAADCLMRQVMAGVDDIENCPEKAVAAYNTVVGKLIDEPTTEPTTEEIHIEPLGVISIAQKPEKTEYAVGEEIDLSGLAVTLDYYYGTEGHRVIFDKADPSAFPNDFIVDTSEFDSSKPGTYTITVSCTEETAGEYWVINNASTFEVVVKETASGYIRGDVTGDTVVDAKDASAVLAEYARRATGADSTFDDAQIQAADVDGDTIIDAKDASKILAYYAAAATGGSPSWD
ncbi:MAG: GDSL-type esterase/lipase family protein [Ruminococcus sp.]